jgi:hypothetical protein
MFSVDERLVTDTRLSAVWESKRTASCRMARSLLSDAPTPRSPVAAKTGEGRRTQARRDSWRTVELCEMPMRNGATAVAKVERDEFGVCYGRLNVADGDRLALPGPARSH